VVWDELELLFKFFTIFYSKLISLYVLKLNPGIVKRNLNIVLLTNFFMFDINPSI